MGRAHGLGGAVVWLFSGPAQWIGKTFVHSDVVDIPPAFWYEFTQEFHRLSVLRIVIRRASLCYVDKSWIQNRSF